LHASKAAGCAETPNKVQGFLSFAGTGDSRNKSLVTVVLLLGGLIAAYVSAQLVLADDWRTLNNMAMYFAKAYLWILVGVLFRLPELALSAQFAPGAPAPGKAGLAEQRIFPRMNGDSGGVTLASYHEG
jgi:hypothetical protein